MLPNRPPSEPSADPVTSRKLVQPAFSRGRLRAPEARIREITGRLQEFLARFAGLAPGGEVECLRSVLTRGIVRLPVVLSR